MNLTYRGTTYQATAPAIEATESNHTGVFLGARFQMKQYQVSQRHTTQPTELTYRGVSYTR